MNARSLAPVAGLAALALFVSPLRALTAPEDSAHFVGSVLADERDRILPGVSVVALLEGVTPAGSAVTDADGRFHLEVPAGEYDLRAIDDRSPLVAGFLRELRIAAGQTLTADFRLVTVQKSLIATGIDPEWLVDTDADGVPDLQERALGWDHKLADTDEDGLSDGLVAWVGGDAKLGAPRTELAPEILWPAIDSSFPLDEALSVELLFRPIPGATGYHLRVFTKDVKQNIEETFDVAAGTLLLGEACALRWSPPVDWGAGRYELRLRGYFGAPGEWVGKEAAATFDFHTVEELQPLVLSDDRELSGFLQASTILITKQAELVVPAGEFLHLVARDGFVLEELGSLRAAPGEEDKQAGVIWITSGADVELLGTLATGDGLGAPEVHTPPSGFGGPSTARALDGGPGGDLIINAAGSITVGRLARVSSGVGGRGGNARAEADPGYDALAIGGRGGRGGRLLLHANTLVVADRKERVISGAGGAGGDARARGGDGKLGVQAGLSNALPGAGGDAGDLWLSQFDLRRDGYLALGDPLFPVAGGVAGEVGLATPIEPVRGQGERNLTVLGREHEVICTEAGGGGWSKGGAGQTALAIGGEGFNAGAGGLGIASSGPGGRLRRLGLSYSQSQMVVGFLPQAGPGGLAQATGGAAGVGIGTPNGAGGGARATGGEGGTGWMTPSGFLSRGGEGGEALAQGIDGLDGASGCPGRGQDGSDGGAATATSGSAGPAVGPGGRAGRARAVAGSGADGGMGLPGGRGGKGGDSRATAGHYRRGLTRDGEPGIEESTPGVLGQRGPRCPD